MTTFEGSEKNCEEEAIVSPQFAQDIERLCQNIMKHVQEVSGGNTVMYRLELWLKLDKENRL